MCSRNSYYEIIKDHPELRVEISHYRRLDVEDPEHCYSWLKGRVQRLIDMKRTERCRESRRWEPRPRVDGTCKEKASKCLPRKAGKSKSDTMLPEMGELTRGGSCQVTHARE